MKDKLNLMVSEDLDSYEKIFSHLAEKAALKLTSELFSRLIVELYPPPTKGQDYTPPPIELAIPLYERLYLELLEFIFLFETYRETLPSPLNNYFTGADIRAIMAGYTPIAEMVYKAYKKGLEDFKRRYKEDIGQTVAKAKSDDRRAIFKLIKWDKTWLQMKFVRKHIAAAQFFNDKLFFEKLADAIRKKSSVKKIAKEENILQIVKFYAKAYDLKKSNGFKNLHNVVVDCGILNKDSNLHDFKYFMKQLRRHGIA